MVAAGVWVATSDEMASLSE